MNDALSFSPIDTSAENPGKRTKNALILQNVLGEGIPPDPTSEIGALSRLLDSHSQNPR